MIIENYIDTTEYKDISKCITITWKKNFRIIMWLAPLMIPISFIAHAYFNVIDFTWIFIFLTIFIYGEKILFEYAFYKKQARLLKSDFKSDNLHYTVELGEKEITIDYNQIVHGQRNGTFSYESIKRIIESKNYYNIIGGKIIGSKTYILPIDKRNLSDDLKKELLVLLESKNLSIYRKQEDIRVWKKN